VWSARLNHKSQNANPKQISMTKIQNLKRFEHRVLKFGIYSIYGLNHTGLGSNIGHGLFVGWVEHPDIFC
jgi:hypothetical protein